MSIAIRTVGATPPVLGRAIWADERILFRRGTASPLYGFHPIDRRRELWWVHANGGVKWIAHAL